MKNNRLLIVCALYALLMMQILLLWYAFMSTKGQQDPTSVTVCSVLILISAIVDTAVGAQLLRMLKVAEASYSADVAEQHEQTLEEYRKRALRDQASLRSVALMVEHELELSRLSLEHNDVQTLNKHLHRVLDEASRVQTPPCENAVIAAVLQSKKKQCEGAGVSLVTNVTLPEELPLDDVEIASVFFNLIDNALHECETLINDGAEAPVITVDSSIRAGQLFVEVSNPCRPGANLRRNMATNDSSVLFHGLGTGIVQDIARRNEGITEFGEHNGQYVASVMIPLDAHLTGTAA